MLLESIQGLTRSLSILAGTQGLRSFTGTMASLVRQANSLTKESARQGVNLTDLNNALKSNVVPAFKNIDPQIQNLGTNQIKPAFDSLTKDLGAVDFKPAQVEFEKLGDDFAELRYKQRKAMVQELLADPANPQKIDLTPIDDKLRGLDTTKTQKNLDDVTKSLSVTAPITSQKIDLTPIDDKLRKLDTTKAQKNLDDVTKSLSVTAPTPMSARELAKSIGLTSVSKDTIELTRQYKDQTGKLITATDTLTQSTSINSNEISKSFSTTSKVVSKSANDVQLLGKNAISTANNISKIAANQATERATGPTIKFGSLAGTFTEMESALEQLDTGLSIYNEQVRVLSLATKVTGGNNIALNKTLRASVVTGNMNNQTLGKFADLLGDVRDTYQISVDNLVNALQGVVDDLELAFFGVGEQFMAAVAQIEGKFGAGSSDLFKRLASTLKDPNLFGRSIAFGFDQPLDKFLSAQSPEEQIDALQEIAQIVTRQTDSYTRGMNGLSKTVKLDLAANMLGSKDLIILSEAITKLQPKDLLPGKEKVDPFANLQVALDKAIQPLQELALVILPPLIELIPALTAAMLAVAAKKGWDILATALPTFFGTTAGMLRGIKGAFSVSMARGFSSLIMTVVRLLGPIGLIATGIFALFAWMKGSNNEEERLEKERADEERRTRLAQEREKAIQAAKEASQFRSNKYLEMQSMSLQKTLSDIMFGNELAQETVKLLREQLEKQDEMIGQQKVGNRKNFSNPSPSLGLAR